MRCADCGVDKALDEFPSGTNPQTSGRKRCKACKNALARSRIRARWGNTRHYHLKQKYCLSAAEVEVLKSSQGGLCPVCQKREAVHVDHDHETRRIRGILCEACNGFLGAFRDDPQLLRAAIEYLEKSR